MKSKRQIMLAALSLTLAATMFTSCGKSKDSGDTSSELEINATREDVDALQGGEQQLQSETTEPTSEEETTEATTDENGEPTSQSNGTSGGRGSGSGRTSGGGQGGRDTGTTEEEYYTDEDAPKEIPTPDVTIFGEQNVSDKTELWKIKLNGKYLDIRNDTLDKFIDLAGIKQNKKATFFNGSKDDEDCIFFYGKGYGVFKNAQDESKRFEGTLLFLEGLEQGSVATVVDPSIKDRFKIRCAYSSIGATKDDYFIEYANGVHTGMKRSEIEKLLGSGDYTRGMIYYANKDNCLVIRYDIKDKDGKESGDDTATEIYLFNDFKETPIQYVPAEEIIEPTSEEEIKAEGADGEGNKAAIVELPSETADPNQISELPDNKPTH